MGKAGTALGLAGLAISALTVASLVVDHMVAKEMEKEREDNTKVGEEAQFVRDVWARVKEQNLTPEQAKSAYGQIGEDAARGQMSQETMRRLEREGAVEKGGTTGKELFDKLEGTRKAQQQELLTNLGAGNEKLSADLKQIFGGNMKVNVVNAADFPTAGGAPANAPQGIVPPPMPGG